MPIPALTDDGFLPEGIHDATLEEVQEIFGRFRSSDRRVRLFENFRRYVQELNIWRNTEEILLDGSFISSTDEPNDIDMVVVYREGFDYSVPNVPPAEYNVISRRRVKRIYGFDVLPTTASSAGREALVELFSNDSRTGKTGKGLVRIRL